MAARPSRFSICPPIRRAADEAARAVAHLRFVWMLHIMDYDERENVNNALLRIFTWGAVLMALSDIWLLFYSFHRRNKRRRAHDRQIDLVAAHP